MKSFTLIASTLLLGATATPIAHSQRQTAAIQASINNFSARTTTNSNGATITYNISIPNRNINTLCHYADATSSSKLPNVDQIPCDDPAVRWQFRQDPSQPGAEGRYRLVVILQPASSGSAGAAGFREWLPTDFPLLRVGEGDETVFVGGEDFVVQLS